MRNNDKHARAYDHLEELAEGGIASAKAFLSVLFNLLSADDFIEMAENEFEWQDPEEDEDTDEDATEDESEIPTRDE